MKRSQSLFLSILLAGLALAGPKALLSAPAAETTPAKGLDSVELQRVPPGLSQELLAQGREVYADLQAAASAVTAHDAVGLREQLHRAQIRLDALNTPPWQRALRAQMAIIRNDLDNLDKPPDRSLWVPVEAEMDEVLLFTPESRRPQVQQALRAGQEAAVRGDRSAAAAQLDMLENALTYRFQAFPLGTVRSDVASAQEAAKLDAPYWRGADEAVQSALAEMHWLTRSDAHGLLTAYYAMADAYALWPSHPAAARNALRRAAETLNDTPGTERLTAQAQKLAANASLAIEDIFTLLNQLKHHITGRQQAGRAAYSLAAARVNAPATPGSDAH